MNRQVAVGPPPAHSTQPSESFLVPMPAHVGRMDGLNNFIVVILVLLGIRMCCSLLSYIWEQTGCAQISARIAAFPSHFPEMTAMFLRRWYFLESPASFADGATESALADKQPSIEEKYENLPSTSSPASAAIAANNSAPRTAPSAMRKQSRASRGINTTETGAPTEVQSVLKQPPQVPPHNQGHDQAYATGQGIASTGAGSVYAGNQLSLVLPDSPAFAEALGNAVASAVSRLLHIATGKVAPNVTQPQDSSYNQPARSTEPTVPGSSNGTDNISNTGGANAQGRARSVGKRNGDRGKRNVDPSPAARPATSEAKAKAPPAAAKTKHPRKDAQATTAPVSADNAANKQARKKAQSATATSSDTATADSTVTPNQPAKEKATPAAARAPAKTAATVEAPTASSNTSDKPGAASKVPRPPKAKKVSYLVLETLNTILNSVSVTYHLLKPSATPPSVEMTRHPIYQTLARQRPGVPLVSCPGDGQQCMNYGALWSTYGIMPKKHVDTLSRAHEYYLEHMHRLTPEEYRAFAEEVVPFATSEQLAESLHLLKTRQAYMRDAPELMFTSSVLNVIIKVFVGAGAEPAAIFNMNRIEDPDDRNTICLTLINEHYYLLAHRLFKESEAPEKRVARVKREFKGSFLDVLSNLELKQLIATLVRTHPAVEKASLHRALSGHASVNTTTTPTKGNAAIEIDQDDDADSHSVDSDGEGGDDTNEPSKSARPPTTSDTSTSSTTEETATSGTSSSSATKDIDAASYGPFVKMGFEQMQKKKGHNSKMDRMLGSDVGFTDKQVADMTLAQAHEAMAYYNDWKKAKNQRGGAFPKVYTHAKAVIEKKREDDAFDAALSASASDTSTRSTASKPASRTSPSRSSTASSSSSTSPRPHAGYAWASRVPSGCKCPSHAVHDQRGPICDDPCGDCTCDKAGVPHPVDAEHMHTCICKCHNFHTKTYPDCIDKSNRSVDPLWERANGKPTSAVAMSPAVSKEEEARMNALAGAAPAKADGTAGSISQTGRPRLHRLVSRLNPFATKDVDNTTA